MADDVARRGAADRDAVGRRAFLGVVGSLALAGCSAASEALRTSSITALTSLATATSSTAAPTSATAPARTAAQTGATSSSLSVPQSMSSAAPSTLSTSSTSLASTRPPLAGPPDYAALARSLDGRVVLPGDGRYRAASELFNPRFDGIHPQAVAQCASAGDVAECVTFARMSGVPIAIRSGGHCYEGWSVGPGLVIDTGPLGSVTVGSGTARVGAGARLIDVYAALAAQGVGISGGSCPSVGIAGLTLGGGIGVVDRTWGLACDNLLAVEVVTADGKLLQCSPDQHADLFWACRGGAGGTFGVATSFTFQTRPIQSIATWGMAWPWSRAAAVIDAWLRWLPAAPDELWGSVHLSSSPGSRTPSVSVVGTYFGGDIRALDRVLDGLTAAVGSQPKTQYANPHSFLDAMLIDAGCGSKGFDACHLEPAGTVTRQAYAASSDWIDAPLTSAGTATLLSAVQQRHDTEGAPDVAIQLDASGGAINRVSPAATAFVHRGAICSVQYIANWYANTAAAAVRSAAAWPHQTRQSMQTYVSGAAYQNYVDAQIADWRGAYFGANYPRLQRVKAAYDPDNLFRHPQSVTA